MEKYNKEVYWSQFSSGYEEKQSYVTGQEVITATKVELWKEQDLGSVLELGCGTGLYTEILQKVAKNILATDLSDEMIEAATQKRGSLENVTFMKADALNLPFDQNRFDTVFMANFIHIIGDPEQVIKESRRVVKEGGRIIITSFAVDEMSFFNRIFLAIRYFKAFGKPSRESLKEKTSKERIEALLLNIGFRISKSMVIGNKAKAIYISGIKE
jgi:ABC-2 type transport system ATP-binding protein